MMAIAENWDVEGLAAERRREVRGEVAFDPATRAIYSTAACIYRLEPVGVVAPLDAHDVAAAVDVCRRHGVPITARGGASSLAGQALGDGLILDFAVHMNRLVLREDEAVWVQPGLICDELNSALAPRGLWFPPDPSSSGYCTIGGMVANNSAGSHSVKYGATIDYVEELDVVLADGATAHLHPYELDGPAWRRLMWSDSREAQLHAALRPLLESNRRLILDHQPGTTKNASGYRLERALDGKVLNLAKVVCGSEGTLALVVAAKLRVVPFPKARRAVVFHFADVASAGRAVVELLPLQPSAIEIHERTALEIIRQGRPDLRAVLPRPGESQLFVEFDGASEAEAGRLVAEARDLVEGKLRLATRCLEPRDQAEVERLWAVRKATLPLLYRRPGPKRIVPCIEDATVPPERISEYLARLYEILARHGVEAAVYGHASEGNFHTRPFFNLHDPADIARMRAVSEEVFDLTVSLGGTISGEHGDGIARTAYLKRLYGPLVRLFAEVKRVFDPQNLLNPGKIVPDGRRPYSLTSPLRFEVGGPPTGDGLLVWADGGPGHEAERCHGCGTCRTLPVTATRMCPVFKALGLEEASPRAKANILREALASKLKPHEALAALERVAGLCLVCGSCGVECPSGTNVPKLILEVKARLAREGRNGLRGRLFARLDALSRRAVVVAPLLNALNRTRAARWALERLWGIDRRRPLPPIAARPLSKRLRRERAPKGEAVVYFPDVYAEYSHPSLGEAVVGLLEAAGLKVVVPPVLGCGILAMCYGDVDLARRTVAHNLEVLVEHVRSGREVVVSEPTALFCLRDAYAYYLDDPRVGEVAAHCHEAVAYLVGLRREGRLRLAPREMSLRVAYHTPCHSRAAGLASAATELLAGVPGLRVEPVEGGCCGMGGTAGMRREGYDLSMKIGATLFEKVRDGRFDGVVTECSACGMQIAHATGKPAWHPVELLASAALGAELPGSRQ